MPAKPNLLTMAGHPEIDQRSLRLALAVASKIDHNPPLLDQEGRRLRQSSPFVGILTAQERWAFYR